jgi:TonB family protein
MPTMALFSTDDYPLAAISRSEEGSVKAELVISPAGRVDSCRILESSYSAALDVATCAIMQRRARYTPARDNMGRPVEDRQTVKIRWKLDDAGGPAPFNSWAYRTVVTLDEHNQPVGCRYEYGTRGADLTNCETHFVEAREALAGQNGLPQGKPGTLVFEHRFEAGPIVAPAMPGADPGKLLLSAVIAEFEINPGGKLEKCRTVLRQGRSGEDLCKSPFSRRFSRAGSRRDAARIGRLSTIVYAAW